MKSLLVSMLGVLAFTTGMFAGGTMQIKDYNVEFSQGGWFGQMDENFSMVLKSRAELDNFINQIMSEYMRDDAIVPEGYWTQMESQVREFYAKYDTKFFEQNDLVLALVDRGSGSVRYELGDLAIDDGHIIANVTRISGMIMTMDYVEWVMMLEINKSYNTQGINIILESKIV